MIRLTLALMTVSANAIQATRPSLKHHKCLIASRKNTFCLTYDSTPLIFKIPVSVSTLFGQNLKCYIQINQQNEKQV